MTNNTPIVTPTSVKDFVVDESQPTTSIQIRLTDGSRLIGKFNHTHTVAHVRAFIDRSKPSSSSYTLATSFPPKPIDNESQTLAEAGLLNSVIVQKNR